MFVQCTRCQHAFDAPGPTAQCPRCGGFGGAGETPVPKTMAMDPSMVAEAIRSSLGASPRPLPIPVTSPGAFASFAPPAPHAPYAPYAQPPQPARPSERDLAGHAILSVILSAVAFLGGGCNVVGLAGVILGLMAHNDANNASPSAPARAKTARVVAVVALVLTALVWAAGATFYLLMSDGSGAPASLRLTP